MSKVRSQQQHHQSFSVLDTVGGLLVTLTSWIGQFLTTLFVFGYLVHLVLLAACLYSNPTSVMDNISVIGPLVVFGLVGTSLISLCG